MKKKSLPQCSITYVLLYRLYKLYCNEKKVSFIDIIFIVSGKNL